DISHGVNATRERRRRVSHVQHRLRYRVIASDHIAVHDGLHSTDDLWVRSEVRNGAADLGRPDESYRAPRRFDIAALYQSHQRARNFQYRRRARSVVVGAGPLMTQVARVHDLFGGSRRSGNDRRYDVVVALRKLGFHGRVKSDLLAARKAGLIVARAPK